MGVALRCHQPEAEEVVKNLHDDPRDASSAYPDWREQNRAVEQMYVNAGSIPPSRQIWADGVDVRDSPELWSDAYLRPHRGMKPIVWARIRRDDDGLTVGYSVDGQTGDTPEEAAAARIPEGWTLVYATTAQPPDWEAGTRSRSSMRRGRSRRS